MGGKKAHALLSNAPNLKQVVANLTKDAPMAYDSYMAWFASLQDDEQKATDFITGLVEALLAVSEGNTKKKVKNFSSSKKAEQETSKSEIIHRAAHTIHFVILFFPFVQKDKNLRVAVTKWLSLLKSTRRTMMKIHCESLYLVHVMTTLKRHVKAAGDAVVQSLLTSPRVIECSFVPTVQSKGKSGNGLGIPSDESEDASMDGFLFNSFMDFPFIYMQLCQQLHQGIDDTLDADQQPPQLVLQTIAILLKQLPRQLMMQAAQTESTVLALIHMLRCFVASRPIMSLEFIANLHGVLDTYIQWPAPYWQAARHAQIMLERKRIVLATGSCIPSCGNPLHSAIPGWSMLPKMRPCLIVVEMIGRERSLHGMPSAERSSSSPLKMRTT